MAENTSNLSDSKLKAEDFTLRAEWVDGVIALVTVLGNLLVILLILTRPSLRKMENWFVVSLAVADFFVAAIPFPLRLVIGHSPYHGNTIDLISYVTHNFFLWASSFNLCALTLDRYVYIVHPMIYFRWKKKTNLIKVTLAAWLVAFFIPLIMQLVYLYNKNVKVRKSNIVLLLCLETLPCLCLPTAYFRIVYFVRRQKAQMNMQIRQVQHNYVLKENPERRQTSKRSKLLVLGGVTGFFVLSNIISIVRDWLTHVVNAPETSNTLYEISLYLIHANSAINVFVYGLFKEDFRRDMKKLFCKLTRSTSNQQPAAAADHIEPQ